jgi:hypothetical protein
MKRESRGIVTLATEDPRYLEMAVDMALSAEEHTSLPVTLLPLARLVGARATQHV